MKDYFACVAMALLLLVGGCAGVRQQSVPLADGAIGSQTGKIGVAMTAIPPRDTEFPGASCLLCMAFAASANSSLTAHAKTLPYETLSMLKDDIADTLRKKGAIVTVINESIKLDTLQDSERTEKNIAKKDFSSFRSKYNIDKLLVVNISSIGFVRTYSAYFPTSDPKANLQGVGYIVDLRSNSYEWYQPVSVTKNAEGNWDEPPKFPGLTNAYFQALEIGKLKLLRSLGNEL